MTCRPQTSGKILEALHKKNIQASVVGELTSPEQGMVLVKGGKAGKLVHPIVDPFWKAFYSALDKYKS